MPYPDCFYKESTRVRLVHTSTPTGLLENPLDLANKPRPWLTLSSASSKENPQKKTLIFADPVFKNRKDFQRHLISRDLYDAYLPGFKILILGKNGVLSEWNKQHIPDDYECNCYPQETIRELALTQHKLSASSIFTLDYFGLKKLSSKEIFLDFEDFKGKEHFKKLIDVLQTTNEYSFELSFALVNVKEFNIDKFISWVSKNKTKIPLNKITAIRLNDKPTADHVKFLTQTFPRLGQISPLAIDTIKEMKEHLGKISEVSFNRSEMKNISGETLAYLFQNAPFLEELNIYGSNLKGEWKLPEISLKSLLIMSENETRIEKENLTILLCAAANSIKKIKFYDFDEQSIESFNSLPPNKLSQLEEINIYDSEVDKTNLKALFLASPNLQEFSWRGNITGTWGHPEPFLLRLKKLNLSWVKDITPDTLFEFLNAAPSLEELDIYDVRLLQGLKKLAPNQMSKLKKLTQNCKDHKSKDILDAETDINDLFALLNAAPALEEMEIAIKSLSGLKEFPQNQMSQLKKMKLTCIELDMKGLSNLLNAAPEVEELAISVETLASFNQFTQLKLGKVKKLTLSRASSMRNIGEEYDPIILDINDLFRFIHVSSMEELILPYSELKGELKSPIYLDKVKVLRLGNISGNIAALLRGTPSLIELSLSTITNIFDKTIQLKQLKRIHLFLRTFSVDDMRDLLLAAPALEAIELGEKSSIGILRSLLALIDTIPNLPLIRLIYTGDHDLKPEEVKKLINIGIRFEKLTFSELKALPPLQPGTRDFPASKHILDKLTSSFFDPQIKPTTLSYTEYFPGVPPAEYRLSVWQPNLDTLEGPGKFNPDDFKPITLEEIKYSEDTRFVKGIKVVNPDEGTHIILPSLDPMEKLSNIEIIDKSGRVLDSKEFEIHYSESTQFHSIKFSQPGSYTVRFQVAIPDFTKAPPLPQAVEDLRRKYDVNVEDIKLTAEDLQALKNGFETTRKFANYIQTKFNQGNPIGSCIHRSIALYEELEKIYKNNVRIRCNDLHAIIELKIDKQWYPLDLGGYPVNKVKLPMKIPVKEEETLPFPQGPAEVKLPTNVKISPILFPMQEITMDEVMELDKPSVLLTSSDRNVEDIYVSLSKKYASEDICVIHDVAELNLTALGMTHTGEVKPSYTLFSRWLKQYIAKIERDPDKKSVVCVDIRLFNPSELAQLNDLLDGTIEDQKLPNNLRILFIDTAERGEYGPDFRRRVPNKSLITSPTQIPLLAEAVERKESKEAKKGEDVIEEIDLFGSHLWQRILLGNWELDTKTSDREFSFYWKKGKLFEALESAKTIIFKNPPLEDPSFATFIAELKSLRRFQWADQITHTPGEVKYYQSKGYDWQSLAKQTSIHSLHYEKGKSPLVLSDANIMSFIQDPFTAFSTITGRLISRDSHLTTCSEAVKTETELATIDVVCAPDLSEGTLAHFLTEAQKRKIHIRFLTPDINNLPEKSALKNITKYIPIAESKGSIQPALQEQKASTPSPVSFKICDDVHFATRKLLKDIPSAICLDLAALEATDLGRAPDFDEKIRNKLLTTGKFSLDSELGFIVKKLKAKEHVILQGPIPSHLYEALTSLALGHYEGEPFEGKLMIIVPSKDVPIVKAITRENIEIITPTAKKDLIKEMISQKKVLSKKFDDYKYKEHEYVESDQLAVLEKKAINHLFNYKRILPSSEVKSTQSDIERADHFDAVRVHNVQLGLSLNSWAMIEGPSAIGKTAFLQHVLPKAENVVYDMMDWLTKKPEGDKRLTLVLDEANFMSQLSGEGQNFLERFKSLQANPPGFLWKGHYYTLTPQHKILFSFNPESYGAGRSTAGFLSDYALTIPFHRLPDYYIRARITTPLFQKVLPDISSETLVKISAPLIEVYQWIAKTCGIDIARELKAMINLIASQMKYRNIQARELTVVAQEVAHWIGRQVIADSPELLDEFDIHFKPTKTILNDLNKKVIPKHYPDHQQEAYFYLQNLAEARQFLQENKLSTDLGLGGVLLEGMPKIGKSHFMNQWVKDYETKTHETVYRISPSTPYLEKVRILKEAFSRGAIVIADELNVSLWPNKLLNNFLMGLEEDNTPAKKPGFMLIATQNPASLEGRFEEDPAVRRRLIKLSLNWPIYEKPDVRLEHAEAKEATSAASSVSGVGFFTEPKGSEVSTSAAPEKKP